MVFGKILAGKPIQLHQANSQYISHHHLCGSAAGGGQVIGTGFFAYGGIQHQVTVLRQKTAGITHHADQGIPEVPDQGYQHFDLGAFAAFTDDQHHIVLLYHAQIAVNGVGGMHKKGGGAGRVQCRHDLLSNDRTFANAADDQPAF